MSRRYFEVMPVDIDTGGKRLVHRIFCSRCEAFNDQVAGRNGHATTPVPVLEKAWRTRGWIVGKSQSCDVCPTCANAKRKPHPVPQTAEIIPMPLNANVPPEADKVPTLDKANRRVILSKLEDVYDDEDTGYKPGWTDRKVAIDLGVPVEWVAELREANFGETGDNAAVRQHVEQIQAIEKECRELLTEMRQTVREQRDKIDSLDRQCTGLSNRLRDLQQASTMLVKSVA